MKIDTLTKDPYSTRAANLNPYGLNANLNFLALIQHGRESTSNLIKAVESFTVGSIHTLVCIDTADAKMRKTNNPHYGQGLIRVSRFQIRVGFSYEAKASTKEQREAGKEAQAPRGKVWIDNPYWMRSLKSNEVLLACSSVLNNNSKSWILNKNFNEVEVEKEHFLAKGTPPNWYTVGLKKIIRIT